ncbi:MAG TPA: hypothetical protein VKY19_09540 [Ktedonosporobacter sp.]|nr:hypothetical protein [Ktedonosporobacter sp.]
MRSVSRTLIPLTMGVGALMVLIVVFHLGGSFAVVVGQFSPVVGAFLGGSLVLLSTANRVAQSTKERTFRIEQTSWLLIGVAIIAWGMGESIWRYYVATGQKPFPSFADIGYSAFPLIMFVGLLLQPSSNKKGRQFVLLMDSLIAMGAILAIAWFLLLGTLAQNPGEPGLATFLGLYYPISDTALLSCVFFLLLRGQDQGTQSWGRRISLFCIGMGLCFFVTSDFIFNIQQNAGTYIEATWTDLGWPLGMMTIGIAASLRSSIGSAIPIRIPAPMEEYAKRPDWSPFIFLPYVMVGWLFAVLAYNVLSVDKNQQAIRPVLLFATLGVVGLIVIRQVVTMWENVRLMQQQVDALHRLEQVNRQVENQAQQIADQNAELERGIEHLKAVLANLANGNLQARASLTRGILWPLAAGLNIMAERIGRIVQDVMYAQRMRQALKELSTAIEQRRYIVPERWHEFPEVSQLLSVIQRAQHKENISNVPDRRYD